MEEPTWTVVKFLIDDTVEAIPSNWILGKQCYWPSLYNKEKLNYALQQPDAINTCWPLYDIHVFRNSTFDNYLVARQKANLAENTSDLGSDIDSRKIRKRKHTVSSSDEDEVKIPTPPRRIDIIKKKISSNFAVEDVHMQTPTTSSQLSQNIAVTVPKETCSCCPVHKEGYALLQNILRNQSLIKNILTDVLHKIDNLPKQSVPRDADNSVFTNFILPIGTEESLTRLESILQDVNDAKIWVKELSKTGGSNVYDFMKRALKMLFTDEFASKYSWYGAKKKNVFKDLKVAEVLTMAAQFLTTDKKECEQAIMKWLRRAKERSQLKN